MTLIDADKLMEDVRKNSESYFADDFAKQWVDRQQTVDAIPVEWITKYMRSLKSGTFADPAWIIKTMLEEWREEQGHDLMD